MKVVKPTSLGFADNGELWHAFGGPRGLIAFLEAHSVELRDWFVKADWADEDERELWPLPLKNELYPLQNYVNLGSVENYKNSSRAEQEAGKEAWEVSPTVFLWREKYFVFQGTHRLEALYQTGQEVFYGWFLDLDALTA